MTIIVPLMTVIMLKVIAMTTLAMTTITMTEDVAVRYFLSLEAGHGTSLKH